MQERIRMPFKNLKRFESMDLSSLGEKLFSLRDFTPVPLILLILIFSVPNVASATIGTFLVLLGELIRIYSVAFIGGVSRTRKITTTGQKLVTTGPFGIVRNPLYCGNFLITFGFAVYSATYWLPIVAIILFVFQYHAIVRFEERLLSEKFGRDFEDYKAEVPAWIPKSLPRLSTLEWPESFSAALYSERRSLTGMLLMFLALILIAS